MMRYNQRGITLVEVLAVLVILGILATVAVPAIGKVIENSRKDALIASALQIYETIKLVEVSEGEKAIDALTTKGGNGTIFVKDMARAGYLSEMLSNQGQSVKLIKHNGKKYYYIRYLIDELGKYQIKPFNDTGDAAQQIANNTPITELTREDVQVKDKDGNWN